MPFPVAAILPMILSAISGAIGQQAGGAGGGSGGGGGRGGMMNVSTPLIMIPRLHSKAAQNVLAFGSLLGNLLEGIRPPDPPFSGGGGGGGSGGGLMSLFQLMGKPNTPAAQPSTGQTLTQPMG